MFAQKTMMFVRAPDENVFIAPFNLVEIFLVALPLEWWVDKKLYERINDYVMAVIYSPLLVVSAYFEVRTAQDIVANRARGEGDDDTIEEWEQMAGHLDFEADGWSKRVMEAKSNLEEEANITELKRLRCEVEELKNMIGQLHKAISGDIGGSAGTSNTNGGGDGF